MDIQRKVIITGEERLSGIFDVIRDRAREASKLIQQEFEGIDLDAPVEEVERKLASVERIYRERLKGFNLAAQERQQDAEKMEAESADRFAGAGIEIQREQPLTDERGSSNLFSEELKSFIADLRTLFESELPVERTSAEEPVEVDLSPEIEDTPPNLSVEQPDESGVVSPEPKEEEVREVRRIDEETPLRLGSTVSFDDEGEETVIRRMEREVENIENERNVTNIVNETNQENIDRPERQEGMSTEEFKRILDDWINSTDSEERVDQPDMSLPPPPEMTAELANQMIVDSNTTNEENIVNRTESNEENERNVSNETNEQNLVNETNRESNIENRNEQNVVNEQNLVNQQNVVNEENLLNETNEQNVSNETNEQNLVNEINRESNVENRNEQNLVNEINEQNVVNEQNLVNQQNVANEENLINEISNVSNEENVVNETNNERNEQNVVNEVNRIEERNLVNETNRENDITRMVERGTSDPVSYIAGIENLIERLLNLQAQGGGDADELREGVAGIFPDTRDELDLMSFDEILNQIRTVLERLSAIASLNYVNNPTPTPTNETTERITERLETERLVERETTERETTKEKEEKERVESQLVRETENKETVEREKERIIERGEADPEEAPTPLPGSDVPPTRTVFDLVSAASGEPERQQESEIERREQPDEPEDEKERDLRESIFSFDFDEMKDAAKELTDSTADQIRIIEREIRAKQREFRSDFNTEIVDVSERHKKLRARANNFQQEEAADKWKDKRLSQARDNLKLDEGQIAKLLQALEELKLEQERNRLAENREKEQEEDSAYLAGLRRELKEELRTREVAPDRESAEESTQRIQDLRDEIAEIENPYDDDGDDEDNRMGTGLASRSSQAVMGGIGLAGLFTISGLISKGLVEGRQLDDSRGRIGGLVEVGDSFGKSKGIQDLGVKQADFQDLARRMAIGSGTGERLQERTTDALRTERGLSLDPGTLAQMSQFTRAEEDRTDIGDAVIEMLAIFQGSGLFDIDKGDFTQVNEKLGFLNELNQKQAQTMETIDYTRSAELLAITGGLGGSFADQRQGQRLDEMNRAITNPGDEFRQALVYKAISESNPDAGLFETEMIQERGIFDQETLFNTLDQLSNMANGVEENFYLLVKDMFGMPAEAAKRLADEFMAGAIEPGDKGKNLIREYVQEDVQDDIGREISGRAAGNVGEVTKLLANVNTLFGRGGEESIEYVSDKVAKIQNEGLQAAIADVGSDITGAIRAGFRDFTKDMKSSFTGFMFGTNQPNHPNYQAKQPRQLEPNRTANK